MCVSQTTITGLCARSLLSLLHSCVRTLIAVNSTGVKASDCGQLKSHSAGEDGWMLRGERRQAFYSTPRTLFSYARLGAPKRCQRATSPQGPVLSLVKTCVHFAKFCVVYFKEYTGRRQWVLNIMNYLYQAAVSIHNTCNNISRQILHCFKHGCCCNMHNMHTFIPAAHSVWNGVRPPVLLQHFVQSGHLILNVWTLPHSTRLKSKMCWTNDRELQFLTSGHKKNGCGSNSDPSWQISSRCSGGVVFTRTGQMGKHNASGHTCRRHGGITLGRNEK